MYQSFLIQNKSLELSLLEAENNREMEGVDLRNARGCSRDEIITSPGSQTTNQTTLITIHK